MTEAYIGLGSNLGDPQLNLHAAFSRLRDAQGVLEAELSGLYRSAPLGYLDQDWFINGVARLKVALNCYELFDLCRSVEESMKRMRDVRWGPRIIDLDILWMEGVSVLGERLQIPHLRAHERAFVLRPLSEFDETIELNGRSVAQWLGDCGDQELEKCE